MVIQARGLVCSIVSVLFDILFHVCLIMLIYLRDVIDSFRSVFSAYCMSSGPISSTSFALTICQYHGVQYRQIQGQIVFQAIVCHHTNSMLCRDARTVVTVHISDPGRTYLKRKTVVMESCFFLVPCALCSVTTSCPFSTLPPYGVLSLLGGNLS